MKKSSPASRGFTLIELLVAIAIIGILASIVYANFGPARENARDAQRKSDLAQIAIALKLYREKNGDYPDAVNTAQTIGDDSGHIETALNGFMPAIPKDPVSDSSYQYLYDYRHNCDGETVTVIFTRALENGSGNLSEVCGGLSNFGSEGSASSTAFVIILD